MIKVYHAFWKNTSDWLLASCYVIDRVLWVVAIVLLIGSSQKSSMIFLFSPILSSTKHH